MKVGGSRRETMRWSQSHCLLDSVEQHWVLRRKEKKRSVNTQKVKPF